MLGAIIDVLVPNSIIEKINSHGFPYVATLAVAVPMYVCATGSIPIAAALVSKGFPPGSAVIFLIAGPATNTVTLSFVKSRLGTKAFLVYITTIIAIALLFGFITDLVIPQWKVQLGSISEGPAFWIKNISAVTLLLLFILPQKRA